LDGFYSAEFHALFVRGEVVTVSHVEKVSLHNNVQRQQSEIVSNLSGAP